MRTLRLGLVVTLALLAALVAAILAAGSSRLLVVRLTCTEAGTAAGNAVTGWESGLSLALGDRPGGGLLAAVTEQRALVLIDTATGLRCADVPLADARPDAAVWWAAWSPDGSALALTVGGEEDTSGQHELIVLSKEGIARRVFVTEGPIDARWAPDGRSLAVFTAFTNHAGTPVGVWIVSAEGGEPRELELACNGCPDGRLAGWADDVAWSADGTRLALGFLDVGAGQAFHAGYNLWVGSVADGRLRRIDGRPDLFVERWLDGETVLARQWDLLAPDPGLWTAVSVADGTRRDHPPEPEWGVSADGRYRLVVPDDGSLRVSDTTEHRTYVIFRERGLGILWAYWAPDGRGIVFTTQAIVNEGEAERRATWISTIDGSVVRRLGEADTTPLLSKDTETAAWQPVTTVFEWP
jgi:hypothetical protein